MTRVGIIMITDEVQEQIIEILRNARASGKLGLTTRQIAQQLKTYRGRIVANASVLKERKVLNCQKIGASLLWYLTDNE